MAELRDYAEDHRIELTRLLATPPWRQAIDAGLVDRVRRQRLPRGATRDFIPTVVEPLLTANETAVRGLIAGGCRDRDALVDRLGAWPAGLAGAQPKLAFLGLTLTWACNFDPRCVYCTQHWREPDVDVAGWKRVIDEATRDNGGAGPYVYLTGGEALILEEELWGDDGLIAYASRRGAAVNVNTNAALITPQIALRLIAAGTAKLHVSLDTPDAAVQDQLWGEAGRCARVLEGMWHLQLARDLVGVDGPEIHVNCVLTRHNLDEVGRLWRFLLARKKRVPKGHPLFYDLLPHIIPVGGDANEELRPTAADVERFYGSVWPEVTAAWDHYQVEVLHLPEKDRGPLFGPFRSPFARVEHRGDLAAYARNAAGGHYGDLALSRACYVAPTQACLTPDGLQYRCGAHAVRRTQAIGSVLEGGLRDNIRAGLPGLADLPRPEVCASCALATVYINQSVERRLGEKVDAWLAAAVQPPAVGAAAPEPA